jgi:hypothetical protein
MAGESIENETSPNLAFQLDSLPEHVTSPNSLAVLSYSRFLTEMP